MVGLFISPLDRRYWALKRIFVLVTVSLVMTAMLLATAVPVFAVKGGNGGGATVSHVAEDGQVAHNVITPSDNTNTHANSNDPETRGNASVHSNHEGNNVAQGTIPSECV